MHMATARFSRSSGVGIVLAVLTTGGCGGGEGQSGGSGNDGCAFVGSVHGAGWGGPPSCSVTDFTPGDVISCTLNVVNTTDLFVGLLDPATFDEVGGSGFVVVSADGPVTVDVDTTGAQPGTTYILDYDAAPSGTVDGVLFVTAETTNNYFYREYRGPGFGSTTPRELKGCSLVTLTAN